MAHIIEIIKAYNDFYSCCSWADFYKKASLKSEVDFLCTEGQSIRIYDIENKSIYFGIKNDIFNTVTIKLTESLVDCSKEDLIELSNIFSFDIADETSINQGSIKGLIKSPSEYNELYASFQNCLGKYYTMIYGRRGNDEALDNVIYVHFIGEVALSDNFRKKIYPVINTNKNKYINGSIEIVKTYDEFDAYFSWAKFYKTALVKSEIEFPGVGRHTIRIVDSENHNVWFDFGSDVFNTVSIKLAEGPSDCRKEDILELSNVCFFQIEKIPFHPELIRGVINSSIDYAPLYLSFQYCFGKYYVMVFATRGNSVFLDDIIYVHFIGEVHLSNEYKKRFFPQVLT